MTALLRIIPVRLAFICAAVAVGLSLRDASPEPIAQACGGPTSDPIIHLMPLQWFSSNWEYEDEYGQFGVDEELSWAYPFALKHGVHAQVLQELTSETPPTIASESTFRGATNTSARQAAARKVVNELLDLPAARAVYKRRLLFEAAGAASIQSIGVIELGQLLSDAKTKIPNGYRDAIQKTVAPATWAALHAGVNAWLAKYPAHVLKDFAQLWKVHLYYLAGDSSGAWQVLFDVYERRPIRVAAEMHFLLVQDMLPTEVQLNNEGRLELLSLLIRELKWSEPRWNRLWELSEESLPQPLAVNLQERLLFLTLSRPEGVPLPQRFPAQAKAHSTLWGNARAINLMNENRWKEAGYQLFRLAPSESQAGLVVRYHLHYGQPEQAVRALQLDAVTQRYLLETMMSESQLEVLVLHPRESLRNAARLALAARRMSQNRLLEAAHLMPTTHGEERKVLLQAAHLADDRSADGLLAFARYMNEHRADILTPDRFWFRSLSPAYATERIASPSFTNQHLAGCMTGFHAISPYAKWLAANPDHSDAVEVLKEADTLYNFLLNYSHHNPATWGDYLEKTPQAEALRAAGKEVRAKN